MLHLYDRVLGLDKDEESTVVKVERWLDGLFVPGKGRVAEGSKEAKDREESRLTTVSSQDLLQNKLTFHNNEKRHLIFDETAPDEKESLALQALKKGQIDFADPRVHVKPVAVD